MPQSIEQPIVQTTTLKTPITYKSPINVHLTKFKMMLQSCIQRHNSTYNMYSPLIKTTNPLATALQTGKNIRLPLVLPILNGDFQNHGKKMT